MFRLSQPKPVAISEIQNKTFRFGNIRLDDGCFVQPKYVTILDLL